MKVSIGLCVFVSLCSLTAAQADDDAPNPEPAGEVKASGLRVDNCPPEEAPPESETAEETDARHIQLAGDAYDRGLVLYEEGNYDSAVEAFVDSYCQKAHPATFYNIAQSYERLLDFERSVQYFERYVAEAENDSANAKKAALRAEVLRNLPAQVRIATVPAGASVTIRNKAGIIARGTANGVSPLEVRQGQYTIHVEKPGYETIVQGLETKPGKPYSYYLSLKPEETGLQVTVSPGNARIFVDKRLVGVGNYAESLPLGNYEIMVESPGRESVSRNIQLTEGKLNNQIIELAKPQQSGRRELLVASGVGLGITGGLALGSIFDQDPAITAVAALTTTAVGFGGAYYGIPESVTRGDAWYLIESTLIGFTEGALIGSMVSCKEVSPEFVEDEDFMERDEVCTDGVTAGAAITGAMVGAVAATATRSKFQLTTGDAALIGSASFWGLVSASFFYAIFESEYRLRDPMLLIGLNLGLVAGTGLVANSEVSLRRVAIIDLAGLGGMVGGIGLSLALNAQDSRVEHFALFGLISGLVGGTFLTRSLDDEPSGATSLTLSPGLGSARDVEGKSVMSVGLSATF